MNEKRSYQSKRNEESKKKTLIKIEDFDNLSKQHGTWRSGIYCFIIIKRRYE